MIILLRAWAYRALLFGLLWWVLTDGAVASWYVGAPTIVAATMASVALLPPYSWSITGIVCFVPFFLWHSLRGGADVAWRALHPGLPIDPDLIGYPLRLPPGRPRVLLVKVVNLLPGTLGVSVDADTLLVHVLNANNSIGAELMAVEQYVGRIFGISLKPDSAGEQVEKV